MGNTSIFITSPLRAEQKHELNDSSSGVSVCVCARFYFCFIFNSTAFIYL